MNTTTQKQYSTTTTDIIERIYRKQVKLFKARSLEWSNPDEKEYWNINRRLNRERIRWSRLLSVTTKSRSTCGFADISFIKRPLA